MKPPAINDPATLCPTVPFRAYKVVLVVDLVESVRLMANHEAAVVARWSAFMDDATRRVLPLHRGRLIKSLGDGLLAEFGEAGDAVRTALELHAFLAASNHSLPTEQHMHLRAGINASHLYVSEYDVYGHGVNLAVRVAALGEAGDTVVTAPVHDGIVDGVDGEVEAMGEICIKHWPEPVRTWRVYPLRDGETRRRPAQHEAPAADCRPCIAVVPFNARTHAPEHFVIGELIADGMIAQLARSQDIRVLARLGANPFRSPWTSTSRSDAQPHAAFVLSGGYAVVGHRVLITAELADARRGEVVWGERLDGDTRDLIQVQSGLIQRLSAACTHTLLNTQTQRTLALSLP